MYFQDTATGWPEWVARLPGGFSIFAVMRPDILRDARAVKATIFTILRHWNDYYPWASQWEAAKDLARQWFAYFIDDTFKTQYAQHVMAVTERNEYDSHTLPPAERALRILWMQAVSWVWNNEYKAQLQQFRPGLPPIQLVLGENAVGNDLPIQAAQLAIDNGDLLGYHPYMAVYGPTAGPLPKLAPEDLQRAFRTHFRDGDLPYGILDAHPDKVVVGTLAPGDPSPNEWEWASGRWHFMEQAWGLKPNWVFGEFGPVRDASGTGWLQPNDGWRHPAVCGGDVGKLIVLLDYWLGHAKTTPAYNEGRIKGFHFFTTPGNAPWQLFKFGQPEMNTIADWIAVNWKPGQGPPPEPPRTWKKTAIVIPQDATDEEWEIARAAAEPTKTEISQSMDNGLDRPSRATAQTAIIYAPSRWGGAPAIEAFRDKWYTFTPPTVIEYKEFVPPDPAPGPVDHYDAPIGTVQERMSDQIWPGQWVDANPYLSFYQIKPGVWHYHTGSDLNLNHPTWDSDKFKPVYAVANGTVTFAGLLGGTWGLVVVVRHTHQDGSVVYSRYAHLEELTVAGGQEVIRGQQVGTVGRPPGDPPGPYHLHFDISTTAILASYPGHWPGANKPAVLEHYVDPRAFIEGRRQ